MSKSSDTLAQSLAAVQSRAREAGVFGPVTLQDAPRARLECKAKASGAPAAYRVEADGGKVWVSLVTADRWLSESIESDLMHTGDKLDELIEEELVELGCRSGCPGFEHYRSDDKLFTFRTAVPLPPGGESTPEGIELIVQFLLAYEACFRNLGDMNADEDE